MLLLESSGHYHARLVRVLVCLIVMFRQRQRLEGLTYDELLGLWCRGLVGAKQGRTSDAQFILMMNQASDSVSSA